MPAMRTPFCTSIAAAFCLTALLANPAVAQQPSPPRAQPAPASQPKGIPGVRVERDIAYVPGGDPAQKLDIYLPEKDQR